MSIQSNFPAISPSLLLDFASTKQLDNRVTFTRSTPAVYYDGKTTAMAEQNFFLWSENFAQAQWAVNNATKTSTTSTDPAGGSTALLLTKVADDGYSLRQYTAGPSPDNKSFTYTIYLKGTTSGSVRLFVDNGVNQQFNSDITITTSWTRYTLTTGTFNSTVSYLTAGIALLSGSVSSVYVAFAQIEQRSVATAYTPTTTQPITNYIPVLLTAGGNQPRFDCNPTTGESLGLLIEEQRTNITLYSEQFDNAAWSKVTGIVGAPTILANQVIAPDGTLTGDQVTLPAVSGSSAFSLIDFPFTASAATYTGSFYLKGKNGGEVVWINFTKNGVNYTQTLCTLTTSWQRFSLTSTLTAGSDNFQIGVDLRDSAESATPAQTFFIWGAQLEVGAFATSYIATTSASATRTADQAVMTGTNFSSWFNAGEGTMYAEGAGYATSNSSLFVLRDSTSTYANQITLDRAAGNTPRFTVNTNGATVAYIAGSGFTSGLFFKLIGAYKVNDFAGSFNASSVGTDNSGVVSYNIVQAEIGRLGLNQQEYLNGTIKKIAYYPIRVSNTNLQALTS